MIVARPLSRHEVVQLNIDSEYHLIDHFDSEISGCI